MIAGLDIAAQIEEWVGGLHRAQALLVVQLREDFQRRTGCFGPNDPWFEERTRAFFDFLLCHEKTREHLPAGGDLAELARAERGLFLVVKPKWRESIRFENLATSAFIGFKGVETDALNHGDIFDARLGTLGAAPTCLPGVIFHPTDLESEIRACLKAATARNVRSEEALDSLLRMRMRAQHFDHMRAKHFYKPEALDNFDTHGASWRANTT